MIMHKDVNHPQARRLLMFTVPKLIKAVRCQEEVIHPQRSTSIFPPSVRCFVAPPLWMNDT